MTGSTLYTLTGLQPVSYYKVTLMAECDTCKKETPWSEPVTFYVGTDTSGGGTEGVEDATVDVSWLRAGTYIVAIHTHNGTTHKRLVIAR